jgi:hypothetical protein
MWWTWSSCITSFIVNISIYFLYERIVLRIVYDDHLYAYDLLYSIWSWRWSMMLMICYMLMFWYDLLYAYVLLWFAICLCSVWFWSLWCLWSMNELNFLSSSNGYKGYEHKFHKYGVAPLVKPSVPQKKFYGTRCHRDYLTTATIAHHVVVVRNAWGLLTRFTVFITAAE